MAIEIKTVQEQKEQSQLKKEIAKQEATEQADRELRIKSILAQVEATLRKGKKIRITQDMKDLGIEPRITAMIFKYSQILRLAKQMGFLDDSSDNEKLKININSALE